jgi:hypothetical protein
MHGENEDQEREFQIPTTLDDNEMTFVLDVLTAGSMVQILFIFIHHHWNPCHGFEKAPKNLRERRQPEWVPTILDSEDTEQETVHDEDDGTPDENSNLLGSGISYAGYLECQRDGCKRQKSVYMHTLVTFWVVEES